MSPDVLVPAPVALSLLGAGLSLLAHRHLRLQRVIGVSVLSAVLAASVALLLDVRDDGTAVSYLGGWPAPFGITMVVDLFSALMLSVSSFMLLAVFVYALGSPAPDDRKRFFHPVYLVLSAGVAASFLAGDLFNLFVAFEMMLISSYVLVTLGGTRDQVRSGMTYVVINLTASLLFIAGVGLTYAATGTVNMAQLAGRLDELPGSVATALGLLFIVVFGIKAAIFPLFFWLPDSYPVAPTPVTAIFAGLLTKVGVYAIIRTQTLLFPHTDGPSEVLLWIAGLTMVIGGLGAIAQSEMKRILSFHIVSQIGYMIFGLALFSVAGIAGAIFYIVHNIVVKTGLFLVAGMVEVSAGSAALKRVGGLLHRTPVVAGLFAVCAISLAGLPPFSGFVGKVALVEAGADLGQWAIVAAGLAASFLTLFSMTKIWGGLFWGSPEGPALPAEGRVRVPGAMVGATAAVAALSIAIALAAGPLIDLTTDAGESLVDRAGYVATVLPEGTAP